MFGETHVHEPPRSTVKTPSRHHHETYCLLGSTQAYNCSIKIEHRSLIIKAIKALKISDSLEEHSRPPPPVFLYNWSRIEATDDATYQLLNHLYLAHNPKLGQEAAVDTFANRLLKMLAYDSGRRLILTQQTLPFSICGENRSAGTDVCIRDDNEILLLVHRDKRLDNPDDPQAQLIAAAIAAFQCNNLTRDRDLHLDEMTIPGITLVDTTLVDTTLVFYHLTITAALNEAVKTGTRPSFITKVFRRVPELSRRNSEGMKPTDSRTKIALLLSVQRMYREIWYPRLKTHSRIVETHGV
ncbi:hypothetical protein HWV62_25442 [Athelia sp. TMB]|nr:hypothetical protein HWV62_25442 [Athelia sp. TMB]